MFSYTLFSYVLWMGVVTGVPVEPNRKITGCHLKLQNNIKITEVICPLPDTGCMMDLPSSSDSIVLSGTEIRYKCINGRWWEQSAATNLTTTCKGQRWLPPISRCDQDITVRGSNLHWSNLTLWTPPVFTPECGISTMEGDNARPLIHKGNVTKPGEFPWHAGVYDSKRNESRKPICGATIIASRYLLSAAHCFAETTITAKMRNPTELFIIVGKLKAGIDLTESSQQRHDITHIITDTYRGSRYRYQNDMAIIRTKSEITFNSNVSPICMINDYFPEIQENADLWVAGWGAINNEKVQSENLMSTKLPYISYNECSGYPDSEVSYFLTTEKFCTLKAGSTEMSLDEGDSGGGLVTKGPNNAYYLIGIVSLWPKDGLIVLCSYVPRFYNWIFETTSNPYIDLPTEEQWTGVCGQPSQTTKTPATAGAHHPVLPGEFPWHAGVYKQFSGHTSYICGATIISSYTLLSAAHCFLDNNPVDLEVGVGEIKLHKRLTTRWETTAFYEVESLIFNNYRGARNLHVRDIVIIVSKTKISFNSQVSPVCMFQDSVSSFSLPSNELLHIVGMIVDNEVSEVVHQQYISFDECLEIIPPSSAKLLQTEKFCIRLLDNHVISSWNGYGGSGLVWKNPVDFAYYLVGIEILQSREDGSVVLNTDVSVYLSWIRGKLNQIHEAKRFSG